MSCGNNNHGCFGYPLHVDEHRGPTVEFDGVAQIPHDIRQVIDREGEYALGSNHMKQMDAAIAEAKREFFQRHLDALRGQTGGNQYDADGRYIGDRDDDDND